MSDRKMVLTLAAAAFIGMTAIASLNVFLPAIADEFDTTVTAVGQINTTMFIVGAALGLLLGPLADHYGLRRAMILAGLLHVLSAFATAASTEYWMLLVSRLPAGLGVLGAVSIAVAAIRLPENERRTGIGWIVTAIPLSAILGSPLLALTAHYTSWRVSYVALGLVFVLLTALVWRYVPADPSWPENRFEPVHAITAYVPILKHSVSVLLYLADILRGVTWFGFLIYLYSFFIQEHGLSLQQVSIISVTGGSAYLVGTRFGGGQVQRFSLGAIFYVSTGIMGVFGAVSLAGSLELLYTLVAVHTFAFMGGVGFPAITIMISEENRGGQGTAMMLRRVGLAVSQAVGAGAGGAFLALGSYALLGYGLGGFAVLSALVVSLAHRLAAPVKVEPAVGGE